MAATVVAVCVASLSTAVRVYSDEAVIRLDAATVLLQWATGGLAFLWVTTRHRTVGIGYGWLLRGSYLLLAAVGLVLGLRVRTVVGRELGLAGVVLAALFALVVSVQRRKAGVSGQIAEHDRRSAQVAAMTGISRDPLVPRSVGTDSPQFDPRLDLVAPLLGAIGLVFAGASSGGNPVLAIARTLAGAAFLGAVSDAMLLGHWYLVQPGLPRKHISELVTWLARVWPIEVGLFLIPTGMISVFRGAINDGWHGLLGWMWIACSVLTIGLCFVTKAALKEKEYSAVMAATGLLYLAILTAFGTDLVARAVLAGCPEDGRGRICFRRRAPVPVYTIRLENARNTSRVAQREGLERGCRPRSNPHDVRHRANPLELSARAL